MLWMCTLSALAAVAALLAAPGANAQGAAEGAAEAPPPGAVARESRPAPTAERAPRAAWVVSPVSGRRWQIATAVSEMLDDEGYLIAGQRDYGAPGQIAGWVMKVDRRGRTRWWRNFDEAHAVRAFGLAPLPEGGAFVAGAQGDGRTARPWIARVSPKAWVFWERTLDAAVAGRPPAWSGIEALVPAGDGTLVAAGTDYRLDGTTRTWLLRLNVDGEIVARLDLDLGPAPRGVAALQALPDGTLALAGPLLPGPDADAEARRRRDAWAARVDWTQGVLWRHDLAGGPQEEIAGLAPDGAGGVLAGGWQVDAAWFGTQGWTRRFAPDGTAVGELAFGEREMDAVAAVLADDAGGHWLVGTTDPRDPDSPSVAWKRTLDAEGWLGERQMLSASAELELQSATRTGDGGMLVVGWRTIRPGMLPDIWIARFVLPTG
jgi:hypothetical protein